MLQQCTRATTSDPTYARTSPSHRKADSARPSLSAALSCAAVCEMRSRWGRGGKGDGGRATEGLGGDVRRRQGEGERDGQLEIGSDMIEAQAVGALVRCRRRK